MNGIWQMVGFMAGMVALILLLQLLDLPDWISAYIRNRAPRRKLEDRLSRLEQRIAELEQRARS
jgi:hypothetical protein